MNAHSDRRSIDLNADLGEGFLNDLALLDRVSSANVCCGIHAGDSQLALETLRAAGARGVVVGAHPGYDDRQHFGRRDLDLTREQIVDLVHAQILLMIESARTVELAVSYVKPHGALYNQAQRQAEIAHGIVDAVLPFGLPIVGQPASKMEEIAEERGIRFVREGFVDRRYQKDGRLVPRSEPNAVLTDPQEIEDQLMHLIETGFETLCLHGDDPRAVESADLVRRILNARGVSIRGFLEPKGTLG